MTFLWKSELVRTSKLVFFLRLEFFPPSRTIGSIALTQYGGWVGGIIAYFTPSCYVLSSATVSRRLRHYKSVFLVFFRFFPYIFGLRKKTWKKRKKTGFFPEEKNLDPTLEYNIHTQQGSDETSGSASAEVATSALANFGPKP